MIVKSMTHSSRQQVAAVAIPFVAVVNVQRTKRDGYSDPAPRGLSPAFNFPRHESGLPLERTAAPPTDGAANFEHTSDVKPFCVFDEIWFFFSCYEVCDLIFIKFCIELFFLCL